MTLEECSKLLDEINVKRKNLEELKDEEMIWHEREVLSLEKMHKKMIAKLANNNQILEDVLVYVEDENKKISSQAFLIILESRDEKSIETMVNKFLSNREIRYELLLNLGYVSLEAFDTFFNIMKNIGFEKTENYAFISKFLLNYISSNHLSDYIDIFLEVENFSIDFQEEIIKSLRYFEEFQKVLIKLHHENNPYFLREKSRTADTVLTLLLQRQDTSAFKILRTENSIINVADTIFTLIRNGDKSDGKLIAEVLIKAIKNKELIEYYELDEWLYQRINEIYAVATVSSPMFLKNSLEILLLSKDEDVGELLSRMIATQFGDEKFSKKIEEIYNSDNIVNRQEVYNLLDNLDKSDMRKKHLYGGELVTMNSLLWSSRAYSHISMFIKDCSYNDLIISTGKYFPLNLSGYYSTFKEHAEVWSEYLEKNKEKYEAGRWIRYGKYVD